MQPSSALEQLRLMNSAIARTALGSLLLGFVLMLSAQAQNGVPVQGNAGQASQPAGVTSPNPESSGTASAPSRTNSVAGGEATTSQDSSAPLRSVNPTSQRSQVNAANNGASADDNPYDPLLEPPPLPKGKPTLIGGTAIHVDHVRNRLTVQPFGGGAKIKLFVDERSHIYRNGAETTVLGIRKGDRIYVDTMLDGSKVFAKNIRVLTEPNLAEVRGQVIALHPDKGTISVQDQLSSRPVTFAIAGTTKYSSSKGVANSGDVQPGALIDVQFSASKQQGDVAQAIVVLAKPGDNYIFSGVVTGLDMHSNMLVLQNSADDQDYEVHFSSAALSDARALKVGSEVTARATFDGKQYKASNVRIESSSPDQNGEQSKVE
jgi:hypothetical protein